MILHITTRIGCQTAMYTGTYRNTSLTEEGFIHCSTPQQILGTANDYYRGQSGLVLLCISSKKVKSPIVYEDLYEKGMAFPHIYGPLNVDAITQMIDFPSNADGSFSLPDELRNQL